MRTHADLAHAVDAGDGTATGADFDHFDHRDGDRHTTALLEAIGARHLERLGGLRHLPFDQADLSGSAAHVVGQHLIDTIAGRHVGSEDRAPGRAGLEQTHRELDGCVDTDDAAAGMDHEHRALQPFGFQAADQSVQVRGDQRLDEGVGAYRVEALELAHLRRDFSRDRHAQVGLSGQ
ncbi:hypothetical protein D3C79_688960 [compost metagenome]